MLLGIKHQLGYCFDADVVHLLLLVLDYVVV